MIQKFLIKVGIHIGEFNIASQIHMRNKLCNKVEFKQICRKKESSLSRHHSDGFSIIIFHNIIDIPELISDLDAAINESDMWDWICHIEIHKEPYDEMEYDEFDEDYE